MAKSARASRTKRNNAALKKRVFAPVENARNERLHAKLLELAQQPQEKMEVEKEPEQEKEKEAAKKTTDEDVDMDTNRKTPKSKREVKRLQTARAQRQERNSRKKPRNQVSFPSHPMKKRSGKK